MNSGKDTLLDISNQIIGSFSQNVSSFYNSNPRKSQVEIALDVANFLFNSPKRIMFIEAPVGIGKTLGVLIPSILYSRLQRSQITYATATKNLQDQIFDSDLPDLKRMQILGDEKKVLAMGKENYFCIVNYQNNREKFKTSQRAVDIGMAIDKCYTGLRKELDQVLKNASKEETTDHEWDILKIKSDQRKCKLNYCPGHEYRNSFQKHPFITVTNHSQLIQTRINIDNKVPGIVSVYPGLVIIDEAHLFNDNYLSCAQEQLSIEDFKKISRFAKDNLRLKKAATQIKKKLIKLSKQKYGLQTRHTLVYEDRVNLSIIREELIKEESFDTNRNGEVNVGGQVDELVGSIYKILDTNNYISWITSDNGEKIQFVTKNIFDDFEKLIKELSAYNKIIFMSGTLTSTNNSEEEIKSIWGISNFEYKSYESPFSPENQIYLCLPKEGFKFTRNKDRMVQPIVTNCIQPICRQIKGGVLILSNSLELKDKIRKDIGNTYENRNVFSQGDDNVNELSKKFKRDKSSILIASGSFKTGFSVKGEALQAVVITSLPFPVKDDPFIELKVSEYCKRLKMTPTEDNKFKISYDIMLHDLEQSIGRLIRDMGDYGVIYITDSRIYGRNDYGANLQRWFLDKGYVIHNNLMELSNFMANAKNKIHRHIQQYNKENNLNKLKNIPQITYSPSNHSKLNRTFILKKK